MTSDDIQPRHADGGSRGIVSTGRRSAQGYRARGDTVSAPDVALLLGKVRCFANCEARDLSALARITTPRVVPARQVIFGRGDTCSSVYVLLEGAVKLTRGHPGHEAVVDLIGPGGVFGELALFSGLGYAATAVSLSRCRLLAISAPPLLRHLQTSPRSACALMAHMGRRAGSLLDRVERHTRYSAEQATAAHLLEHCDESGVVEPATARCGRRDLGSYLGLRAETLSRVLSRFRKQGWLRDRPDGLQVVDRTALAARLPRGG
jgi:CRP-like cAMP-binding protein